MMFSTVLQKKKKEKILKCSTQSYPYFAELITANMPFYNVSINYQKVVNTSSFTEYILLKLTEEKL